MKRTRETPASSNAEAIRVEPIAMRVPDACRFIGISRSTLYVLIGKGAVEVVKFGASTLILTDSLRALVNQKRQPGSLDETVRQH